MVGGAGAERPEVFSVGLFDRQVVDARQTPPHQPVLGELPILIAIGTEPVAGIVVPFIREPDGDPAVREAQSSLISL